MQYNPALDGIRALSVLAVVMFHCEVPAARGGFIGVDVFFVLSGYLITSLLEAEYRSGGIGVGRFYARRAWRLYPSLLLMLAAYAVLAPWLWPTEKPWLSVALAALYVYDYALAFWHLQFTVGHTWSLGVEEKFYLLWPLLLPLLLRSRRLIGWLLIAFLAVTLWRYFVAVAWSWPQAYFAFDTHVSGILLGAIAAQTRLKVSRVTLAIAWAALAIAATLPSLPTTDQVSAVTVRITLAELSAFVLVRYASAHGHQGFLALRPIAYIGKLSYGIYLWHFPAALVLRDGHPWWVTLIATMGFSFSMAAICLHFVDMPIRRWREETRAVPAVRTASRSRP